jgi:hypothetical protein
VIVFFSFLELGHFFEAGFLLFPKSNMASNLLRAPRKSNPTLNPVRGVYKYNCVLVAVSLYSCVQ